MLRPLCQRETHAMVEAEFMECHDPKRAKKLADKPISLPTELEMPDVAGLLRHWLIHGKPRKEPQPKESTE